MIVMLFSFSIVKINNIFELFSINNVKGRSIYATVIPFPMWVTFVLHQGNHIYEGRWFNCGDCSILTFFLY